MSDANPYEPPVSPSIARAWPRVPYAKVFFGTALTVLLGNALLYAVAFLTFPPPGSPGTFHGLFWFLGFELFNLPGLPPFLVLHFSDLVPDEDEWIRGAVFIACSALAWSVLVTCISPLIARIRQRGTPSTRISEPR